MQLKGCFNPTMGHLSCMFSGSSVMSTGLELGKFFSTFMCFILQVGLDGELKAALSKLDLKLQAMEQRDLSISTDFGKITHVQTDLFEVLHAHRIRVRRICMHMEESDVISSVFVSYFVPYSISPSPFM